MTIAPQVAPQRLELMAGAQTDFCLSKAWSPVLIAGKSYGKTIAFCAKAFTDALRGHSGGRGVLTQPTFDMIRRNFMPVWDRHFGHLTPKIWEYRIIQQGTPQEIAFKHGFTYDLRPATNEMAERFRGATYCKAGMDEIRNEDQLACYLVLSSQVRCSHESHHIPGCRLLPCNCDSLPGEPEDPLQFYATTTPEARRPWIRKIWTDHVDPIESEPLPANEYPKFKARMEDNWHLSEAQKRRMRALYGGQSRYARQELDAEDVALEGAGFENFGAPHFRDPPEGHKFVRTIGGIDFGATSPTAMYEIKLDRSDRAWFTREFYMRNADDYDWVRVAAEWGLPEIICDPSRSDKDILELRRKYGVNLKRAHAPAKRFEDRVRLMRNRLAIREDGQPRMYVGSLCPNLRSELTNLAFAQPRVGEYAVDRWETGALDHGYDGSCYGLSHIDLSPPNYKYRPRVVESGWDRTFA